MDFNKNKKKDIWNKEMKKSRKIYYVQSIMYNILVTFCK